MRGGTIHGNVTPSQGTLIEGGRILGLLTANSLDILGGSFEGGVASRDVEAGVAARIQGGAFSESEFSLRAIGGDCFDIFGGDFVSTLVGYDSAYFNEFGRNLRFDREELRGRLADGSRIRVPVQLFDSAELWLIDVPEPGPLALLLAGGLAMLLSCRRPSLMVAPQKAVETRARDRRAGKSTMRELRHRSTIGHPSISTCSLG